MKEEDLLLFLTLAIALVSLLAAAYVVLRLLLPLLPAHHLSPRGSKQPVKRLKSAQRFHVWLAALHLVAVVLLVWEMAISVGYEQSGLGGTAGGASRFFVSATVQCTLLCIVAILSYVNVMQGVSLALGKHDWILWLPALVLTALGAGLMSMRPDDHQQAIWIGLLVWIGLADLVVLAAFGRLLWAILRLRASTLQQEELDQDGEYNDRHRKGLLRFFPITLHPNASALSTGFISQILGRPSIDTTRTGGGPELPTTSTPARDRTSVSTHASRRSVATNHDGGVDYLSRPSMSSARSLRSPTPAGSSRPLITPEPPPFSIFAVRPGPPVQPSNRASLSNDRVSEEQPRPSISTLASNGSRYDDAASGVGISDSAMRRGILVSSSGSPAVIRHPPRPATPGRAATVELTKRETRLAVVRIGGHLLGNMLSFGFMAPFLLKKIMIPTAPPTTLLTVLAAVSICSSGPVLAAQVALTEGFWFASAPSPSQARLERQMAHQQQAVCQRQMGVHERVLDEESLVEMVNSTPPKHQQQSSLSSRTSEKPRMSMDEWDDAQARAAELHLPPMDRAPGIDPGTSLDVDDRERGPIARAASVVFNTHPRLMVLPSTAEKQKPAARDVPRRSSFTLGSNVAGSASAVSLATTSNASTFVSASSSSVGHTAHLKRRSVSSRLRAGSLSQKQVEADMEMHSVAPLPSPAASASAEPSPAGQGMSFFPKDYTIDYLSSQLLPRLVPTVKVGKDTPVAPEPAITPSLLSPIESTYAHRTSSESMGSDTPLQRPSSPSTGTDPLRINKKQFGYATVGIAAERRTSSESTRNRNFRNLSLPGLGDPAHRASFFTKKSHPNPNTTAKAGNRTSSVSVSSTYSNESDGAPARRKSSTFAFDGRRASISSILSSASVPLSSAKEVSDAAPVTSLNDRAMEAIAKALLASPDGKPAQVTNIGRSLPATSHFQIEKALQERDGHSDDEENWQEAEEDEEEILSDDAASPVNTPAALFVSARDTASRSSYFSSTDSSESDDDHAGWANDADESEVEPQEQSAPALEDGDWMELGTIHCATVLPVVSRTNSIRASNTAALMAATLPSGASDAGSVASRTTSSSITSRGFMNQLATGSWHTDPAATSPRFPAEEPSRSLSGLRPLALLGERDPNYNPRSSIGSVDSGKTTGSKKARRYSGLGPMERRVSGYSSTGSEDAPPHRGSIVSVAESDSERERIEFTSLRPPPEPEAHDAIEPSSDKTSDKASGSPTPKAARSRRTTMRANQSSNDAAPVVPAALESHVTTRSRARQLQGSSSRSGQADENLASKSTTTPGKSPRRTPKVRKMRL